GILARLNVLPRQLATKTSSPSSDKAENDTKSSFGLTKSICISSLIKYILFAAQMSLIVCNSSLVQTLPVGLCGLQWMYMLTSSRSEEHTSELQSRFDLVCRLLLEKKQI